MSTESLRKSRIERMNYQNSDRYAREKQVGESYKFWYGDSDFARHNPSFNPVETPGPWWGETKTRSDW